MAILSIWWAYKRGIVGLLEVRVWLAAFEAVARRCGARDKRRRRFVEHELAELVCVSEERVRSSLRRLERAGFLHWKETAVRFDYGAENLTDEQRLELRSFIERVTNHRRKVPMPRRVLRLLCRATRPVLIATTLGHALRCLYYRNNECCPDGRSKASWVANVFEVDVRNVKAARRELVELGLLVIDATDQRSMNRWGPRVRFDLTWQPPSTHALRPPPRPAAKPGKSPPPNKNRELVSRYWNQKPAARGPVGASASRMGTGRLKFERVTPRDLAEPERIATFLATAIRRGLIRDSESERLNVFAAAEHARTYGTMNPCGMFVWLVKNRRWTHLTLRDEDGARHAMRSLQEHLAMPRSVTLARPQSRNGSASDAATCTAPEAARRLLAGTGSKDYPILDRLAASLKHPAVGVSVDRARPIRLSSVCRTPSVAIGSSPPRGRQAPGTRW
jgi:hypothetical protein